MPTMTKEEAERKYAFWLGQKAAEEAVAIPDLVYGGDTSPDDPSKVGTGALKYDAGKPAVYQGVIKYFPRALWGVAEISTFGAKKYAWNGWADVVDGYNRYQDAKFRHALLDAMGQEYDEDSKELHLKHEAWGALAALELYLREKEGWGGTRSNAVY